MRDWIAALLMVSVAVGFPVSNLLLTRPGFKGRMERMSKRRRSGLPLIVESKGIPIFYAVAAVWFATTGMPETTSGEAQQLVWLLVAPAWVFALWAHRRTAERLSHLLVDDREPPIQTEDDVTRERYVRILGLISVAAYVVAEVMRYRGDGPDTWTAPPSLLLLVALSSLVAMCWITVQAARAPEKAELTGWP